jgi:asparagine synthase (glutamine-hydrolysing)
MRPQVRSSLYSPAMRRLIEGHRPEERYATLMHGAPAYDDLSRAQYANLKLSLPADALARIDRSSMAVGLEARQPLLDHRLVEFAARIPPRLRVRQGTGKWLLKRALEPYLPKDMLYRPEHTAIAPLNAGFRTSLGHEAAALAFGSSLTTLGWFDPAAIGRIAADHRSGRADHGRLLWQLLMLDRSLQRLFGLGAPSSYRASTKYNPSGGALKPSAARSRA